MPQIPCPSSLESYSEYRQWILINELLQSGHRSGDGLTREGEDHCRTKAGQPHRVVHSVGRPLKKLSDPNTRT